MQTVSRRDERPHLRSLSRYLRVRRDMVRDLHADRVEASHPFRPPRWIVRLHEATEAS